MKVYVCIGNINCFDLDFIKKRKRNLNYRHNLLILSKCLNFVFIFENNCILAMVFFLFTLLSKNKSCGDYIP